MQLIITNILHLFFIEKKKMHKYKDKEFLQINYKDHSCHLLQNGHQLYLPPI